MAVGGDNGRGVAHAVVDAVSVVDSDVGVDERKEEAMADAVVVEHRYCLPGKRQDRAQQYLHPPLFHSDSWDEPTWDGHGSYKDHRCCREVLVWKSGPPSHRGHLWKLAYCIVFEFIVAVAVCCSVSLRGCCGTILPLWTDSILAFQSKRK